VVKINLAFLTHINILRFGTKKKAYAKDIMIVGTECCNKSQKLVVRM
jgi:hypothetical protein